VPETATVGLVGGFPDNGAIGAPEELARFRRKLIAGRVLSYSEDCHAIDCAEKRVSHSMVREFAFGS
jgi:hypothetical protein